jgi:hypothetical protein
MLQEVFRKIQYIFIFIQEIKLHIEEKSKKPNYN